MEDKITVWECPHHGFYVIADRTQMVRPRCMRTWNMGYNYCYADLQGTDYVKSNDPTGEEAR